MKGHLVTKTFDYDGGRPVTVYLPPGTPEVVVVAGDGQLVAPWGTRTERAGVPATMIVGIHRSADPAEMVRIGEYSPTIEPPRFDAHERLVLDNVLPWVRAHFAVDLCSDRLAAYGVSAGAEFALAMGVRHPHLFGAVLAASPGGGFRPPPVVTPMPRTYLIAGRQEPFFLENASRWAEALRAAGTEVIMEEREGEHGGSFWQDEFPVMISWAFG